MAKSPPSTGGLRLEVVAGKATGSIIAVEDRIVFGRQSQGPGRLADDPELSRHHAEITQQSGGEYAVEDLSSTNGTFVNGKRVDALAALARGDIIDLGATRLIVRDAPAVDAPRQVDVRAATVVVDSPTFESRPAHATPPAPVPAPAPAPAPVPAPVPTPALELRVVIDFEHPEVRLALEEGGEPVRLRVSDGHWRIIDGRR